MTEKESWRYVGVRIRKLRKENRLTLKQLAAGCDLSPNAISLVERGKVAPTVMTLCKIAHALGVSASSLFQDICPSEVILTRAKDHQKNQLAEIATNTLVGGEAIKPSYPRKSTTCLLQSKMTQMVLCVCGLIEIEVNDQHYQLNPGDSLTLYGDAFHHWINPGKETGIAVMVLTPQNNFDEKRIFGNLTTASPKELE